MYLIRQSIVILARNTFFSNSLRNPIPHKVKLMDRIR